MSKKISRKKLTLNKSTLRRLSDTGLKDVAGAAPNSIEAGPCSGPCATMVICLTYLWTCDCLSDIIC